MSHYKNSASALALFVAAGGAALIPATACAQDKQPAAVMDEIIVTGSRIVQNGAKAPTPLTVVGADLVDKRGATNIADVLNELPAFRGSTTPASTTNLTKNVGANYANLRNLGTNRTLTLVDGIRHVPSSDLGQVDLNFIPTLLIERAEVVTGGASAVYGTDAVAGVVNLILRRQVKGVEARADFGVTQRGDDIQYHAAAVGGTQFAGGRGYATLALEYYNSRGADDAYSRDWGQREYGIVTNPPGVTPVRIIASNVHPATMAPFGLITSGPLRGTAFNADGTPRAFQYGQLAGAQNMIGGEGHGYALYLGDNLSPKVERRLAYLRTGFELSDAVEVFQDISYAWTKGTASTPFYFNPGNLTIRRDNPFLPAPVATQMDLAGVTSFSFGRLWTDVSSPLPVSTTATWRGVSGLKGTISPDWKWNATVEYGENKYHQRILGGFLPVNVTEAIDAVRAPNGAIVCRVALADPSTACLPFNPFGTNRNAPATQNYFRADGEVRQTQREIAASVGVSGKLFDIGAGSWGIAAGGEYRRESLKLVADPLTNASRFFYGNTKDTRGSFNVKEGYVELEAPLLANMTAVQSLVLNAAYRYADYSSSGGISAWKIGGTWDLNDDLRLRVTRSRDVRAPNIPELFAPNAGRPSVTILDPSRGNVPTLIFNSVSGNPKLRPETADTWTYGAVLHPTWFRGLTLSADYYEINIGNAIASLTPQVIVNRCFAGEAALCSAISRDTSGAISFVLAQGINVANYKARGLDLELGYTHSLGEGELDFRVLANKTIKASLVNGSVVTNYKGMNNTLGIPKWAGTAIITYSQDRTSVTLQGRFMSGGRYDNTLKEGIDIADNKLPGFLYVSVGGQYKIGSTENTKLFFNIENIFDKDPAAAPGTVTPTNGAYYDVLGRRFRIGVAAKF